MFKKTSIIYNLQKITRVPLVNIVVSRFSILIYQFRILGPLLQEVPHSLYCTLYGGAERVVTLPNVTRL